MKRNRVASVGTAVIAAVMMFGTDAWAATSVQVGSSGKTYASSAVRCAADPFSGALAPVIEAGLFNPRKNTTADIVLNGTPIVAVTTDNPAASVWLVAGQNTVVVSLSKRTADTYSFVVQAGLCSLPDTSGNTLSPDGTLEYAASGKSYATVTPGCAQSPLTGLPQPYVNLMDNGGYLLNVSVNGVPLTQLSATRPHTPVFLEAGTNVISAANGYLTVDYYVRNGGSGSCALP